MQKTVFNKELLHMRNQRGERGMNQPRTLVVGYAPQKFWEFINVASGSKRRWKPSEEAFKVFRELLFSLRSILTPPTVIQGQSFYI